MSIHVTYMSIPHFFPRCHFFHWRPGRQARKRSPTEFTIIIDRRRSCRVFRSIHRQKVHKDSSFFWGRVSLFFVLLMAKRVEFDSLNPLKFTDFYLSIKHWSQVRFSLFFQRFLSRSGIMTASVWMRHQRRQAFRWDAQLACWHGQVGTLEIKSVTPGGLVDRR